MDIASCVHAIMHLLAFHRAKANDQSIYSPVSQKMSILSDVFNAVRRQEHSRPLACHNNSCHDEHRIPSSLEILSSCATNLMRTWMHGHKAAYDSKCNQLAHSIMSPQSKQAKADGAQAKMPRHVRLRSVTSYIRPSPLQLTHLLSADPMPS